MQTKIDCDILKAGMMFAVRIALLWLCAVLLFFGGGELCALEVEVVGTLQVGLSFTDWEHVRNIALLQIIPFSDGLLRTTVSIDEHVDTVLDIGRTGAHSSVAARYLPLSKRHETISYPPRAMFPLEIGAAYLDIDISGLSRASEYFVFDFHAGYFALNSKRSGTVGEIVNITHAYPIYAGYLGGERSGTCGVLFALYRGGCNTADGGFASSHISAPGFNLILGYRQAVVLSAGAIFEGLPAQGSLDTHYDTRGLSLINVHGILDVSSEGTFQYSTFFMHHNFQGNVVGAGVRYLDSFGDFDIGIGAEGEVDISEAISPDVLQRVRAADTRDNAVGRAANPAFYWEWAANVVTEYADWIALDVAVRGTQRSPIEATGAGIALYYRNMGFQAGVLVSNLLSTSPTLSLYPEFWIDVARGARLSLDIYIADMDAFMRTPGDTLSVNSSVSRSF